MCVTVSPPQRPLMSQVRAALQAALEPHFNGASCCVQNQVDIASLAIVPPADCLSAP